MKKRILYYALGTSDSSSFYRMSGVLPYIHHAEFELIDISYLNDLGWNHFVNADILILQRPFNHSHVHMISLAKDMGLKIILDYDDDLLNVDMYNPTYDIYHDAKSVIKACVELSDEIWVSTQSIKDSLFIWAKNIIVIPNCHNDYLFKVEDKKEFNGKSKTAAWRGGMTHFADVYENADKLVKLINDNKEWRFNFLGERFTYLEQRCGVNYNAITPMTTIQFYKYFHKLNPNIVLFPLRDTKFNRGKSNICWIEATYAGAMFAGNKKLYPEISTMIYDVDELDYFIGKKGQDDFYTALQYNDESWKYIIKNLLLSNINTLRTERLLANL